MQLKSNVRGLHCLLMGKFSFEQAPHVTLKPTNKDGSLYTGASSPRHVHNGSFKLFTIISSKPQCRIMPAAASSLVRSPLLNSAEKINMSSECIFSATWCRTLKWSLLWLYPVSAAGLSSDGNFPTRWPSFSPWLQMSSMITAHAFWGQPDPFCDGVYQYTKIH